MSRILAILMACATAPCGAALAAAKSPQAFDGSWSVLVVTRQGQCDAAYRWTIGVRGGRVTELGDNIARASGSIAPDGRVSVTLTRNADVLLATGRLRGASEIGRAHV